MAYRYDIHITQGTTYGVAGNTIIPLNKAIVGSWNIIDDRYGFKLKSAQADATWDGFVTEKDYPEPRTPQDFVRAVRDQKPLPHRFTRPQIAPTFSSTSESDLVDYLLRKG